MATIIEAARALAEVCDGAESRDAQGFNGADSGFAKSLLSQAWLTQKQLSAMHRMLAKYGGQLARMGFIYSELAIPAPGPVSGVKQAEFPARSYAPSRQPEVAKPAPEAAAVRPEPVEPWTPRLAWTMSAAELLGHFPAGMTPRPKQIEALTKINEAYRSGKRVVVLEMPTGGGKSPICMTVARAVDVMGGKTSFLTVQKSLQDQYTRDFPAPEIEVLKGRSNYPCSHPQGSGRSCADAPCTAKRKGFLPECIQGGESSEVRREAVQLRLRPDAHFCPYWKQLQLCNDNAITLFNFSSFLFQQRIGRFGKRDLMLIDEAHKIEAQIMSFVTLELLESTLRAIKIKIDREISSKDQLMEWLREKDVFQKVQEAVDRIGKDKDLSDDEDDAFGDEDDLSKDLDQAVADELRALDMKLGIFLLAVEETEWVFETVEYLDRQRRKSKKIVARPLFGKAFARKLLISKGDRVLVMSATILDVGLWARNLGLDPAEVALVQTPCDFPVSNRPIHLEYCGSMGYKWFSREQNPKDPTEPKFLKKVKVILDRHPNQRGLIHCQSHALAKLIRENVSDSRLLFQDDFENKDGLFAAHDAKADSVIVSPGIKEGFDFKNDRARFQIIAKVPFASMTDRVVKERMNRQPEWYGWLAALDLVQSYGRIVRSKDDWGYTYIIDSSFEGFCTRNGQLLPVWFREAFRMGPPRELRTV